MSTSAVDWPGGFEPFGADYSVASADGVFLRFPGHLQLFSMKLSMPVAVTNVSLMHARSGFSVRHAGSMCLRNIVQLRSVLSHVVKSLPWSLCSNCTLSAG